MKRENGGVWNKLLLPLGVAAAILVSVMVTNLVQNLTGGGTAAGDTLSLQEMWDMLGEVTLPAGSMVFQNEEIPTADADAIQEAVEEMVQAYEMAPPDSVAQARSRDWYRYTSQRAKEDMSFEEAVFYDRLDEMCQKYIANAALDGKRYDYNDGTHYYATNGVKYSDLGLTYDQAWAVTWWFKYNNPQYYFLRPATLSTDEKIFLTLMDEVSDGDARVEYTDRLFDELDGVIDQINAGSATTWQKELAANNYLCKTIVYHEPYMGGGQGDRGQTLYYALMEGQTVCAGYAQAFCAIMNASGVETVVALSHNHAWNVALMDNGNYYAIDATWNDNKNDDDHPYNRYFNVGDAASKAGDGDSGTHTYYSETAAWTPAIAKDSYLPTDYDVSGSTASAVELSAPANLRMTYDRGNRLGVEWDAVEEATGYVVEVYGDAAMANCLASGPVTGTAASVTYTESPILAVRVQATAEIDGTEYVSGWSELLVVETAGEPAPPPEETVTPPGTPENVRTTANEPTASQFAWDASADAERYELRLFRDAGYTETWVTGFTDGTSLRYKDLQPNTTYYYGLRAVRNVDGKDYYSDWVYFSETTPPAPAEDPGPEKPAEPANIVVTYTDATTATITWDEAEGATGYELRLFKDDSRQTVQSSASRSADERSARIININVGEDNYLDIRAVASANGKEAYSQWVQFSYTHTQPSEEPETPEEAGADAAEDSADQTAG